MKRDTSRNKTFLTTTLLAAAMMLNTLATAQTKILPGKKATTIAKNDTAKTRLGALLIDGPEEQGKDLATKLADRKVQDAQFNAVFKNIPHRIVGSASSSLDFNKISKAIDTLGRQCNELLVFVYIHGAIEEFPSYTNRGILFTENMLKTCYGDDRLERLGQSTELFSAMAKTWRQGLNGIIVDQSCYSTAGARSIASLPAAVKTVTFCDPNHSAYAIQDVIFDEFADKDDMPNRTRAQWEDHALCYIVSAAMFRDSRSKPVKARVYATNENAPDTIVMNGNKLPIGNSGVSVFECDIKRMATNFSANDIKSFGIDSAVSRLSGEGIDQMLVEYRKNPSLVPQSVKTCKVWLGWLACKSEMLTAQDHPEQATSLAQFILEHRLMKPDTTNDNLASAPQTPEMDNFRRKPTNSSAQSYQNAYLSSLGYHGQ